MWLLLYVAFGALSVLLGQTNRSFAFESETKRTATAGNVFYSFDGSLVSRQIALTETLSSGAQVYSRGSDGFHNLTRRWEKYKKPEFAIAVAVATEDDVVQTVKYANEHNMSFLAMTGGHGAIDSLGAIRDGIEIWMRNLRYVQIDSESNLAVIGGGALSTDVSNALWNAGKETVHGICECVSLIGPLLGGGHGFLQGQYGLAADQLVSARVVLANGTVVVASQNSNADLFWALRGAGHNFGIVTELVVKIYDIPPGKGNWTVETFIFAGNQTKQVFEVANSILEIQPPRYMHAGVFINVPAIDPEKPVLIFLTYFSGPIDPAAAMISALLRQLGPASVTVADTPYLDLPATYFSSNKDPACQKLSDNTSSLRFPIDIRSYNPDAMQSVYDAFAEGISDGPRFNNSFMLIEGYSTQGIRIPDFNSTAVPFRDRRLLISSAIVFVDDGDFSVQEAAISWGESMRAIIHEGDGGGNMLAYVNYAHGDEGTGAWYGHESWRMEKLRALKQVWDPLNRFGGYAPIVSDSGTVTSSANEQGV